VIHTYPSQTSLVTVSALGARVVTPAPALLLD
jgi:hypothetical protein